MPTLSSSSTAAPPCCQQQRTRAALPEECLTMIIRYLEYDRCSLHALLQISHQFFRLVVPVLYKSPFRMLESRSELWSWTERTRRQVLLLQLFLRAVEIKQGDRKQMAARRRSLQLQKQKGRQIYPSSPPSSSSSSSSTSWLTSSLSSTKSTKQGRIQNDPTCGAPATRSALAPTSPNGHRVWSDDQVVLEKRRSLRFAVVSSTLSRGRQRWSPRRLSISPSSKKESNSATVLAVATNTGVPENSAEEDSLFQFDDDNGFYRGLGQEYNNYDDDTSQDEEEEDDPCDSPMNIYSDDEDTFFQEGTTVSSAQQPDLDLGPFSSSKQRQQDMDSKNWTRALQRRLSTLSRMVERGATLGQTKATPQPVLSPPLAESTKQVAPERLMTDYLAHYTEHDHPHLVRILPSVCPSVPPECFDQLLSCSPALAAASSHSGFLGGSLGSISHHPMMSLFHSANSHSKNLERAHSIRCRVERDLLQHAPQKIRSLSLSAPRIETILPVRSVDQHSAHGKDQAQQDLSPIASLTSTFVSLLPSSPFASTSMSETSPASTLTSFSTPSTWSLMSMRSSRSSSSCASSPPSISSGASTMSADSISWDNIPRLCQLRHLHRIEIFDIHFNFDVDVVVEFLKAHDQAYHTIREIKVGGPDDVGKSTHPELIRVIQSVRTLKVLDMIEWREATKYLDMIPTRHLESLLLGTVRMTGNVAEELHDGATGQDTPENSETNGSSEDDSEPLSHPQIQALQQCRHLKELKMPVLIDGLLEWAVQERRKRIERTACTTSRSSSRPFSHSFASRWDDGPRPVKLEKVNLSGTSTGPLTSTLIHVMDAFRDSIHTLQGTSWVDSTEVLFSQQSLGWTWMLPRLEILDLQGDVANQFLLRSLQYCPQLRVLRLSLSHSVRPSRSNGEQMHHDTGHCNNRRLGLPLPEQAEDFQPTNMNCTLSDLFEGNEGSYGGSDNNNNNERQRGLKNGSYLSQLQELKLAGNWGLCDETLEVMMRSMPRLRRLAMLRCESEGRLTAQGLIRGLCCLRERVQSLEVSRTWQGELEMAFGSECGSPEAVQPVEIIYHFW